MKKIPTLLFLLFSTSLIGYSQRNCGSNEHLHQQLQTNPEMKNIREVIESQTAAYVQGNNKLRAVITIPVVFHIVYNTTAQNVSDAQVLSQLNVLNQDFRKLNSDWTNTPTAFQASVADCEFQFCLAQQDPAGNPSTGINRIQTSVTAFGTNDAMKFSAQGGADIWDRNKYLNIWVCKMANGVLGYAQFPGGPAATDGVVINHTAFGYMGSSTGAYNLGRTATHEVGHWMNLFHIWGDDGGSCAGTDLVQDTPNQGAEHYGCPSFPQLSCNNGPDGDMFMNFMDYTDDACMYMFTQGQKDRMTSLFVPGGARYSLLSSNACSAPQIAVCNAPNGLSTSNVTSTSATLQWSAVAGALSYTVSNKEIATGIITTYTSTTNQIILNNLTPNTMHSFQVTTNCAFGNSNMSFRNNYTTLPVANICTNNYEFNNTRASATIIANNNNINSMIGTLGDKDFYRITTTNAEPKLSVSLTNLPADYDLKLYNASGNLIASSVLGGTSSEWLKYNNATTGATYFAYVYGYNGANNNSQCYTLNATISASNFKGEDLAQELTKAELNIFPVPASDKVSVHYYAAEEELITVNIYNAIGQKVSQQSMTSDAGTNEISFQIGQYANGMYLMEVLSAEERKVQKFSVQR